VSKYIGYRPALDRSALSGLCMPWDHELNCSGVASASIKLSDAARKALAAGHLPSVCAVKIGTYCEKALRADDWKALDGGEYQWLNGIWRALIYNDWNPPFDCLNGPTKSISYQDGSAWHPPPGDPQPEGGFPWGWVAAGTGVLGLGALYWFVLRSKK
jgi:hypothetical protein